MQDDKKMTAETGPMAEKTPSPKPAVNDRRKLQNRIAQRRFRQKKAMEARAASIQAEGIWHEYFNLHPQCAGDYDLSYLGPSAPTSPTDVPQRGWHPTIEYQIGAWDNQFFGSDNLYLSMPSADIVTPMSPPNSSASSVSPDGSVHGGEAPIKTPCFPLHDQEGYPMPVQQTYMFQDGMFPSVPLDINGAVPSAPRHSFSTEAPHGDKTDASALDYTENGRVQSRDQAATEWKMHKPAQSIDSATWTSKDGEQFEPLLHTAAKNGNCGIIQMLLDHNTDVNERNSSGMTALHVAIENSQEDVIMLLLQRGIDVNAEDNSHRTALSMAVSSNSESGVRLFLMHGADPKLAKVPAFGSNMGNYAGGCTMET
ncbi:hypothetical protein B0T20DRAFT_410759 [Sordaria brevicollis]|uniref:BZIP domain-containing protein n=1 Tax=Sordaria brevicollis TaxID=83679 RepID=A0AAE0UC41_SORBR|nr:hypothetical protein B0T20DRAFT_410759 [Sordaria brevicollis]